MSKWEAIGATHMAAPHLELSSNAAVKVAVESGAAPTVLSMLAVADSVRNADSSRRRQISTSPVRSGRFGLAAGVSADQPHTS